MFLPSLLYIKVTQYTVLGTLFPPILFGKAVELLREASGVSWSQRGECSPMDPDCIMTLEKIFWCYVATFFFWFMLAIYLDNVVPNSNGLRKSVFYFLKPSYWKGEDGNEVEEGSLFSRAGTSPPPEDVVPDDEDVLAEETTVKCQVAENRTDPTVAIQVRGLVKSYPGTTSIGCCKLSKSPPYHAVKGVWLNLPNNQLFCLLGPNGAGKTTTISCLTGTTPVTGGDALIYGCSVRSSVGMSNIRRMIGVCPQFDILWDALSGEEHLHLFASIKGLPPSMIGAAADKLLEDVQLATAAKCRSGSYSGGMKRRLSVAVALIGDPKVVFLDEPTTGMDPLTRRNVWDIIEEAKKGRAIVLTTHSMEEADILSDRIGIMAKGRLRCLGTSIRLKSRFGAGYVANVSYNNGDSEEETSESRVERIKQFFRYRLNLDPKEENEKFLTFLIPNEKEGLLMDFFSELEERAEEFGISDIQLGLSTLEEVFLNIAKQAELESAAAEGDLVPFFLNSGTAIQIPKGARFVGIPGTESSENPRGVMVEIYWEQDESGLLYISDHSPETPIPPNVQPPPPPPAANDGTLVGFAIDPSQLTNDR
ncbi:putative ABC transporter A family member 2 [Iris pallida]|uniref:ABC transporter A family member 2 n=1 Tax=Iris pallida TaxID=29817 RepID=A0AAX6FFL4_IRIPA|nr:putative ABC transporter A family member 2 [Iris pallida]